MSEYATLRETPSTLRCQTKAVSSGKRNRFTETPRGSPSARANSGAEYADADRGAGCRGFTGSTREATWLATTNVVSPDGVFRFLYPRSYIQNNKENTEELGVSCSPICSEGAACVISRRKYYAGTNFQAPSFQVREIHDAMTQLACLKGPPDDVPAYQLSENDQK